MSSCIVVFGREPIPGLVKTRLARAVGSETAAGIYRELLAWTVERAIATGKSVTLSLAAEPSPAWASAWNIPVETQPEGDLGTRMLETLSRRFQEGYDRALIIGSDCPGVGPHHLEAAIAALDHHRVVLGPARDGGYWLVGQRAPQTDCFSGVPWSSDRTLAATRQRLEELGVGWTELDQLDDVDTEAALERVLRQPWLDADLGHRLRKAWNGGPIAAP